MCFSLFVVVKRSLNTTRESAPFDCRHAVGDGHGGQAAAIFESPIADRSDAVWDSDGGQAAAIPESSIADGSDAVGVTVILHGLGNDDIACVFVRIGVIPIPSTSHADGAVG